MCTTRDQYIRVSYPAINIIDRTFLGQVKPLMDKYQNIYIASSGHRGIKISCCFNLALFSSDYVALLIHARTAKSWTSPSLSSDLLFAKVVAFFSFGPFRPATFLFAEVVTLFSLSPFRPATFSFAEVIALFSLGPFRLAFQLFTSTHSQIVYPNATFR